MTKLATIPPDAVKANILLRTLRLPQAVVVRQDGEVEDEREYRLPTGEISAFHMPLKLRFLYMLEVMSCLLRR